ncbi:uroporphyrinogen-III C-methyltransferase [Oculatella sp. LEGE 06141]|nr:uroporphyrinogen-III C-methyltransferase [Oculatella sp. LEGE 06141]
MQAGRGKVYLVGAGPGDMAYMTMRGYHLLTQADVLIYDALVDDRLFTWLPPGCLKLDVGKRGGKSSTPQAEINQLLVKHGLNGQQVVRLKSGDPFIFGRCTAEMQALIEANCPFEVVPGISSALAAPLLTSIPLTDPVLSHGFAVFSAHAPEILNWEALSQIDTLVVLMGARHLSEIVQQLQRWGRSPQTPIAVIRWAGQPQQQHWIGTLMTIEQNTARQPLSPAVIVVGEVVGLRPFLQSPFSSDNEKQRSVAPMVDLPTHTVPSIQLPLHGKTILVTRSAGQSSQFTALLQQQGATVLEMPALQLEPPSSWQALDQAIARLSEFNWLVLTSTNGVDYFFDRLASSGKDARDLAGVKIAVVGQKTAASLRQRGLQPDFIPPNFVADALVEHFPDRDRMTGITILFPRVETGGRELLVQEFTAQGAIVTEAAAYQSGCASAIEPEIIAALEQGAIDIITFASSKTVNCFHQLSQAALPSTWTADRVCIASIGPQTSLACQQVFGRVDVEASEYTLEGLTNALVDWVS